MAASCPTDSLRQHTGALEHFSPFFGVTACLGSTPAGEHEGLIATQFGAALSAQDCLTNRQAQGAFPQGG